MGEIGRQSCTIAKPLSLGIEEREMLFSIPMSNDQFRWRGREVMNITETFSITTASTCNYFDWDGTKLYMIILPENDIIYTTQFFALEC